MKNKISFLLFIIASIIFSISGSSLAYLIITNDAGNEVHWRRSDIPVVYVLNSAGSSDVSQTLSAVRTSFATWENIDGSYLDFTDGGTTSSTAGGVYDNVNLIVWQEDVRDWVYGSGVIGVTSIWFYSTGDGRILETDIEFNGADFNWSTNGGAGAMDVQNIATHEIGHVCGLDDLYSGSDSEKTMYGYSDYGDTSKRTLHSDDEAGIRHLYPSSSSSGDTTPPNTTILSSPSGTVTDTSAITFTYSGTDDTSLPSTLKYSYMLYDYQQDFSEYSSSTSVHFDSLPNGTYTFYVKAKDVAGNVDATPAEATFTIDVHLPDTEAPETTIDSPPQTVVHSNIVNIGFSGLDNQTNAGNLLFSTYLEGYDGDYSDFELIDSRNYISIPDGVYTFNVKCRDEEGLIDQTPASVTFEVDFEGYVNQAPYADAGGDQIVQTGRQVALNAMGSYDAENDALSYSWTQIAGAAVTLSDPASARTTFTINDSDGARFELTVSDGLGTSEPSYASIYAIDYIVVRGSVTPEEPTAEFSATSGDYLFDFTNVDLTGAVQFVLGESNDSAILTGSDFAVGKIMELEPDGLSFSGEFSLTIPYTDDMLVGYPATYLRVYCYDSSSSSYLFKHIDNIDTVNRTVTFSSNVFTKYQLAISTTNSSEGGGGGGCYIAAASNYKEASPFTEFFADIAKALSSLIVP